MYESPIMINVTTPVYESINKSKDEYVLHACQKIGVDISKEELIKALQYDRSQYEKGYADGLAYKPPVETNADLIRTMTDEELAEWFGKIQYDTAYYCAGEGQQKYPYPDGWLDWLRQEAKE